MRRFDVLIAGGGPAGAAAALALLARGVERVALLHRPADAARYRIGESASPGVVPLLRRLGLDVDLADLGHLPCHGNRAVWGVRGVTEQDYLVHGLGHGWHLDRAAFDAWLLAAARGRGVEVIEASVEEAGRFSGGDWGARVTGGAVLAARALVDATGRASALARRLGARRRRLDTLTAVARLQPAPEDHPLRHLSLIESRPEGWWYAAAIPGGRLLTAFMSDADLIREGGLGRADRFAGLQRESDELRRLVSPAEGGEVAVYAAHSGHLDRVAGPGWVAVGDAALGMDPLTSSGINAALADGLAAAEALQPWLESGETQALRLHARRIGETVRAYLEERRRYYAGERRWRGRRFWRRRSAGGDQIIPTGSHHYCRHDLIDNIYAKNN